MKANKQMHRTAAPRCSFVSAALFGRWIRSQRSFPTAVGDPGRWAFMPEIKKALLILAAASALPMGARAQWAWSRTEHDWRLTIGGYSFGLVQQAVYTIDLKRPTGRGTTVYVGPFGATTTRLRAPFVAIALLLPVGGAGALLLRGLLPGKREAR